MKHLPEITVTHRSTQVWGLAKWLATRLPVLLSGALLMACGPGTGGTGVGPIRGVFTSLVTSAIVGIPAGLASPSLVLTPGGGSPFVVVIDAQRVTLSNACLSFTAGSTRIEFDGQLQIDGALRITATGVDLSNAPSLSATLIARVDGVGLQVTLRTPDGASLTSFPTAARLADGVVPAIAGTCVAQPVLGSVAGP